VKKIACISSGKFTYQTSEKPSLSEGKAILKVRSVGICGTDLHAFEGTQPYFSYPRILGHEIAAEVVEISDSSDFSIGDFVTVIPYFNCGKCIACRRRKPNCCTSISVFGVHEDGAMQEYITVPVSSLIKKQGLTLDQLALTEPLAIGYHGVKRAGVQAGDNVLVIGAGPIGLGIMEFVRLSGANVIAMDINEHRLDFCLNTLHVPYAINAIQNPRESISEITKGEFCTTVIDATGSLKAINGGLDYVSHGGNYVLVGLQKEHFSFSHPEFHKRETTLMSSRNATKSDFEQVMNVLSEGKIDASLFITHHIGFAQVATEFKALLDPAKQVIKSIVDF
jgi:2-desacetyl-2-hydroxyethyl bacteriochlorophyllide A dehydrogenase